MIFILAVALIAASACADNGPDLSDVEWSEVNTNVLLLDPRWDYFERNNLEERDSLNGVGPYTLGDPRFDELSFCDGYARCSFDGGTAVILRKCGARKLRDGKAGF